MANENINLLVCGGGNGAHALSTLASSRANVTCKLLTLYPGEAEKWKTALKNDDVTLNILAPDGEKDVIKAKPQMISDNPDDVVKGSNLVVITVPAFAHKSYLEAVAPLLSPGSVVVGMPGHPGFEFQSVSILKKHLTDFVVMSFETLPWACRIDEFGREVTIHGTKNRNGCAIIKKGSGGKIDPGKSMQYIFGETPVIHFFGSYLTTNLNAKIHCPILYGWWSDWDGKPLSRIPLMYKEIPQKAVDNLDECGNELRAIGNKIQELSPETDMSGIQHFREWMLECYKDCIADTTNFTSMFHTNKAYDTLEHPMVKLGEDQYVPDYKNRYFVEDTPFAMAVVKGIALCIGVETPVIDKALLWCQKVIGKEYLVDGNLTGKDIMETRAPQAFGIDNIEDLLSL